MNDGRPASAWLSKITRDQNLNELGDLEKTPWDTIRHWFRSAILQPTIKMGAYDPGTGKVILGGVDYTNINAMKGLSIVNSTTSQQTTTVTVPDGETWVLLTACALNGTRAGVWVAKIGDGVTTSSIGGSQTQSAAAVYVDLINGNGPLVLQATETITFFNSNFVAADTLDIEYSYRVIA